MDSRQGGAAHVNIFFLLIALVFLAGSVFFLYSMLAKQTDTNDKFELAVGDGAAKDQELLLYQHYREDVTDVALNNVVSEGEGDSRVTSPAVFKGRPEINEEDYGYRTLVGATSPTLLKASMAKGLKDLGVSGSSATFDDVAKALKDRAKSMADAAGLSETARVTALTKKGASEAKLDDPAGEIAKQQTEVATRLSDISGALSSFRTQSNKLTGDIARLHRSLRETNDKIHAERVAHASDRKRLEGVNARYTSHKGSLEAVLAQRNGPTDTDGAVVASSRAVARAYVNRGRAHGLISGTVFRITAPRSNAIKAYGTVVSVGAERSEVKIHGLVDEQDPVAQGDLISNDRFTPNFARKIFLLGKFSSPWNRNTVADILAEQGHEVVRKFDVGVDLIIIGDAIDEVPVGDTEEFKMASDLGVEFAPVARIRDLLTLASR